MNKRKIAVLLTILVLLSGCTPTTAMNRPNADLLLSVLTLPIKIVGAALAAAVGAAAGMGAGVLQE